MTSFKAQMESLARRIHDLIQEAESMMPFDDEQMASELETIIRELQECRSGILLIIGRQEAT